MDITWDPHRDDTVRVVAEQLEVRELADALDRVLALANRDKGSHSASDRVAVVLVDLVSRDLRGHLGDFGRKLDPSARVPDKHELAQAFLDSQPKEPLDKATLEAMLPPIDAVLPQPKLDPEHAEWCVRIFASSLAGFRGTMSLSRPFDTEAKARHFYGQTQNVHNAKVRGHFAEAFDIVLGVQDKRKHKKAGSFAEVEHCLCTGEVAL